RPFTTDIDSVTMKSMPHFPHTVDAVIIPMDSTNAFNQHSITKAASTYPTGLGLTIPTRGDEPTSAVFLQRLTDELDRETIPVFIDEPDHFRRFGSSSDAKKAEAAFKSSLVSRSS
ncbi:hypothetical protein WMQ00_11365, partial [Corynebacterium sp. KPL2825]|uniref:hypothetical protein n=1 Tax=Corynebacterium sp. KPL2825 TaxID=3135444 RepID=UPI0030C9D709